MLALGLVRGKSFVIDGYCKLLVLKVFHRSSVVLVKYEVGDDVTYRFLGFKEDVRVSDVGGFKVTKFDGRLAIFGIDIDRSVGVYREAVIPNLDEELEVFSRNRELQLEYLRYMSYDMPNSTKRERKYYVGEIRRLEMELKISNGELSYDDLVDWGTMIDREREIELDNMEVADVVDDSWVEGIHYRLEERTRYDLYEDEWVTEVIEVPIERVDVGIEDDLVEEVGSEEVDNGDDFGALLAMSWSNNNYENELEEELMRLEDYELDMELYGEEVRGQSRKKASKGKKQRGGDDFDTDFGFDGRKRNKISKGKGMNGGTKRTHKVVNLVDDRYDGEDD